MLRVKIVYNILFYSHKQLKFHQSWGFSLINHNNWPLFSITFYATSFKNLFLKCYIFYTTLYYLFSIYIFFKDFLSCIVSLFLYCQKIYTILNTVFRSLLNCVPCVFTFSLANMSCVSTCSHLTRLACFACLRANVL